MFLRTLHLFIFLVILNGISFGQDSTLTYELRIGTNFNDANYGIEKLQDLFPIGEYPIYTNGGESGAGYQFGLGVSWAFSKHFELVTTIDYLRYNYDVTSGVLDFDTIPTGRPIRPTVPIFITGSVGYTYLNIESGIRYSFNKDSKRGFFIGGFISDMVHLNTDWTFDVKFEDQRIENGVDFSEDQEDLEFKNVVYLGVNAGYFVRLGKRISLAPLIDLRFGMNPVVDIQDEPLNPTTYSFNLVGKWNF